MNLSIRIINTYLPHKYSQNVMLFKRKGRFTDNIGNHDSKKKNCQVLFEILLFLLHL